MIIECPCKKKKFNIDINLIPAEGRNLQCGSCDRIWFYKKEDPILESQQINEDIAIKESEESANPNNDNYNIDPSEDNWIDLDYDNKWDSNEGTESNNIWNEEIRS